MPKPLCSHPALQLWFSRVLRDGFAAQLSGTFLPFKHFAACHLGSLLGAHPAAARCTLCAEPSRPSMLQLPCCLCVCSQT